MKVRGMVASAFVIWIFVSVYQNVSNILLLTKINVEENVLSVVRKPITRVWRSGHDPNDATARRQQTVVSSFYNRLGITETITSGMSTDPTRINRSFPRWGTTIEEENLHGMDIIPLMDFIVNSSVAAFTRKQNLYHPDYTATTDHSDDVGKWIPEILYVIDHRGIYMSQRHRNITAIESSTMTDKIIPTEKLMNFSLQLLKADLQYSTKIWPRLTDILIHNRNSTSSGFPMLFWFGDYTKCNYQNWKRNSSVPLFTNAASVLCNHSFPFVTYQTGRDSNVNWTEVIPQQHEKYPWDQKLSKVVWRGGLTGKIINATHKSPRWNMVQMVAELKRQYDNETRTTSIDPFILDVAATRLPRRHKDWSPSLHEVNGLVDNMPMEDFQLYRGIIDADGNSWSSRFGRLLCYNSVVLKVEPSWVDYFYYKDGWEGEAKLQPWVHYIPVKADLSNLLELAAFVTDSQNDDLLQKIVRQANAWCSRNMVRRRISMDILNIWERYMELLDIGSPNWIEAHWTPAKGAIFHPDNPLVMDNKEIGRTSSH
jgi:Glycosyl transferase family 90